MRKLLLLALAACLAFAGCSSDDGKDDNAIRYDEVKGYLTNLASAKHGIIGRWEAGTAHSEYKTDGIFCTGTYGNEILPYCTHTYEILEKNGKIFIRSKQIDIDYYFRDLEITTLDKNSLKYQYENITYSFVRISEFPTP